MMVLSRTPLAREVQPRLAVGRQSWYSVSEDSLKKFPATSSAASADFFVGLPTGTTIFKIV
jgi:hypothetical protein